jgi:hypothetical protein
VTPWTSAQKKGRTSDTVAEKSYTTCKDTATFEPKQPPPQAEKGWCLLEWLNLSWFRAVRNFATPSTRISAGLPRQ